MTYSHKELVEIGYKWVLKNCSVGIAFKELESAFAAGWKATGAEIFKVKLSDEA